MPRNSEFHVRVIAALALALCAAPRHASAQCQAGTPYQFAPPGGQDTYAGGKFKSGYSTSFEVFSIEGRKRMLMRENFGYSIYDLSNPASPVYSEGCDIESSYPRLGDVFDTVLSVGAAADGSRILVSYREPHGNLVMTRQTGAPGCSYNFAGEFAPPRGGGEFIVPYGSRYLGFALVTPNSTYGVAVADVTKTLTGTAAQQPGSIASESLTNTPAAAGDSGSIAGHYLVYRSQSTVQVVDIASPSTDGPISSGFKFYKFQATDVGFPAGATVQSVSAAVHPVTGVLTLLVQGLGSTLVPLGYQLVQMAAPGSFAAVGPRYVPPAPFTDSGATTATTTADDVLFFSWNVQNDASGMPVLQKLTTFSVATWPTDQSPTAVWSYFGNGLFNRAMATATSQWQIYTATKNAAFAIPVQCALPESSLAMRLLRNGTACGDAATPCRALAGDSFSAAALVAGAQDATPPTDLAWSVSPISGVNPPRAAAVNPFAFTIGTPGSYTLTMTGYGGRTRQVAIEVYAAFANSVTTVTSSTNPSDAGQAVTFTATVSGNGAPVGSVQFVADGKDLIAQVPLSRGSASATTSSLAAGAHTITATYSGDTIDGASSGALAQSVTPPPRTALFTLAPCRLFDTRVATGADAAAPALYAGEVRLLSLAGRCGVPSTAKSLSVNVTIVSPGADGELSLLRGDLDTSSSSSHVSFRAGKVRANNAVIEMSHDGASTVKAWNRSTAGLDLVVDVNGYFQ